MAIAEENFIRGYRQALVDTEAFVRKSNGILYLQYSAFFS